MSTKELEERLVRNTDNKKDVFSLFSYKDPDVKDIVWEIKYRKNKKIVKSISQILFQKCILLSPKNSTVISVPQHRSHVNKKGFNQSRELVLNIEKHDIKKYFNYKNDLIKKIRKTKKQSTLYRRQDRLKNLENAFECKESFRKKILGRDFVIIDDVFTTGATFSEMQRVLLKNGAKKVIGIFIAH